ncbi:MAG: hypothetical protein L6R43_19000, partial [Planctomycetes bacterium]|nr:hypothetical protein [Planctomycetota bacterium]
WDPVGFDRHCEKPGACAGAGRAGDRVGTTALALLCFLGYGETNRTPRYGDVVRKALQWFRDHQDGTGAFEPAKGDRFLLNHARATLALAELYGLTQHPPAGGTAQRALDLLVSRRLKEGGWSASFEGKETDLETSAWAVVAIRAGASGGLATGADPFGSFGAWLDRGTNAETGRFGPEPPSARPGAGDTSVLIPEPSETATAMALHCRMWMGETTKDPVVARGVEVLLRRLPEAGPTGTDLDFLYEYFGTQVLIHSGKDSWRKWSEAQKAALIDTQRMRKEECAYGSWDPTSRSAAEGRVACTALGILSLQAYYRYSRCMCGSPEDHARMLEERAKHETEPPPETPPK